MSNNNSKQRIIAIASVIIIGLLGVNAFFLYNNYKQDIKISEQTSSLEESERLKSQLEKQFYESVTELEEMKTNNEELNKLIEGQQSELKTQKDKISKLIRNSRDLKTARAELENMKVQLNSYVAEISQLKAENEQLSTANTVLASERDKLSTDYTSLSEEYTTTKASLLTAKEVLTEKNAKLNETVTYASVVKINNVDVIGQRIKGNNKTTETKKADKIDHLQVCFNTMINEVTQPGVEKFYVRILNPSGETLAIEEMGSGIMTAVAKNEQIRYTQLKEYEYSNNASTLCFNWNPGIAFDEGKYMVEIYNKGYLSGIGSFELK